MTIEQALRDLAKRGELTHVTLWPVSGTKEWQANWKGATGNGYRCKVSKDPAEAMLNALTGADEPKNVKRRNLKDELV